MAIPGEDQPGGHKAGGNGSPLLKKAMSICSWRVPVYVHPSFYRALNLKYPVDVRGVSRNSRVSTQHGTSSLKHGVGILTPEDFQAVVDSE